MTCAARLVRLCGTWTAIVNADRQREKKIDTHTSLNETGGHSTFHRFRWSIRDQIDSESPFIHPHFRISQRRTTTRDFHDCVYGKYCNCRVFTQHTENTHTRNVLVWMFRRSCTGANLLLLLLLVRGLEMETLIVAHGAQSRGASIFWTVDIFNKKKCTHHFLRDAVGNATLFVYVVLVVCDRCCCCWCSDALFVRVCACSCLRAWRQ